MRNEGLDRGVWSVKSRCVDCRGKNMTLSSVKREKREVGAVEFSQSNSSICGEKKETARLNVCEAKGSL